MKIAGLKCCVPLPPRQGKTFPDPPFPTSSLKWITMTPSLYNSRILQILNTIPVIIVQVLFSSLIDTSKPLHAFIFNMVQMHLEYKKAYPSFFNRKQF